MYTEFSERFWTLPSACHISAMAISICLTHRYYWINLELLYCNISTYFRTLGCGKKPLSDEKIPYLEGGGGTPCGFSNPGPCYKPPSQHESGFDWAYAWTHLRSPLEVKRVFTEYQKRNSWFQRHVGSICISRATSLFFPSSAEQYWRQVENLGD